MKETRSWLDLPRPWIFLAPMDGIGDWPFREMCYLFGADLTVSPLVPAQGLVQSPKRLLKLVGADHGDRPFVVQLFGKDPEHFRKAARLLTDSLPIWGIDINFGCPVNDVVASHHGSYLMREPELARAIVEATVQGTEFPVSVKMRTGWDSTCLNAPELAQSFEKAGARAIIVHGRTRVQMYHGQAELETIARTKRAISIPVIGNGDIVSADSARRMLDQTGVDGLMVGRAAFGNPWLFSELRRELRGEADLAEKLPALSFSRGDVMREHSRLAFIDHPDRAGLTLRKHLIAYTKGCADSHRFRRTVKDLETEADVREWVAEFERTSDGLVLAK